MEKKESGLVLVEVPTSTSTSDKKDWNWNYEYLVSDCGNVPCTTCLEPVKQEPGGGWYITMGHAGYNSRANNRGGYRTRAAAIAAYRKYAQPRPRRSLPE